MSNRFNILTKSTTADATSTTAIKKSWSDIISTPAAAVPIIKKVEMRNVDHNNGCNISLNDTYTLWYHGLTDKNWDISSYKKMCTIKNVSEFWRMLNNFDKIGYRNRHLFLMKNNIKPMWEDENNKNGGVCSFKIEVHNSLEIYENLSTHMVLGLISDIPSDINGISFCPKGNTVFVKVWNKDRDNDLSLMLNKSILDKYGNLSIKYIPNKPEY